MSLALANLHRCTRQKNFVPCSLGLLASVTLALAEADSQIDLSKLPPAATRQMDFVKDIQPILAKSCYQCHGPDKQKAELRWDSKDSVFKAGEHGPVLVPGKSAQSLVIQLVAGLKGDDSIMPKQGAH